MLQLISDCGFYDNNATSQPKNLTSPNWPENYNVNNFCEWSLETNDGSPIAIEFDSSSLLGNGDYLVGSNAKIEGLFHYISKKKLSIFIPNLSKKVS